MTDILNFDLCIIGTSAGALAAAEVAIALGLTVALVETGDRLSPNDTHRLTAMKIGIFRSGTCFKDHCTFLVRESEIKATAFILAGRRPWRPAALPGLEKIDFLTPFSLPTGHPKNSRLLVYGYTEAAVELAQRHAASGFDVELLMPRTVLPGEDPELTAAVLSAMRGRGIKIRSGLEIRNLSADGPGVRLDLGDGEQVCGMQLLMADQDQAFQDELNLKAAGIEIGATGVRVSSRYRTSNRRIYAIGQMVSADCSQTAERYQAGLVVKSLIFRLLLRNASALVPRVFNTDPALVSLGLNEAEGRQAYGHVHVYRAGFSEVGAMAAGYKDPGFIKVVTNKRGRILGVGAVGPAAMDILIPWQIAMSKGANILEMANLIVPKGSLSELSKIVAVQALTAKLRRGWLVYVLKFLRRMGFPGHA